MVLLRHGETVGYDGDLGLTPLGERQARERGTALAKEIAPGTDVRMPHARTARATATAEALRAALVEELDDDDGTTVGPLYGEPDLTNLRFALHGEILDTSAAATSASKAGRIFGRCGLIAASSALDWFGFGTVNATSSSMR